jgi:metallo-beta-lactamase family protein
MKLTFLGATRTVTGSLFLLERGGKILIDTGVFQGRDISEKRRRLPLNPKEIDAVVITHAHLDHIGLLPYLVHHGLNCKVFATKATKDLASIMLFDSAHIMEEEYEQRRRKDMRMGRETEEPLYNVEDVIKTIHLFVPGIKYGDSIYPIPGVKITFRDAGHILGSSFLEVEVSENGVKKLIFSGDLGNLDKPIIRDPEIPQMKDPDIVVLESTYGDRDHRSMYDSIMEFKEVLTDTIKRGGNVIIPSFAVERTQEILFLLREFYREGLLKNAVVFLDSPLAIEATSIFKSHPECFDDETLEVFRREGDPFYFPSLQFTRSVSASKTINQVKSGAIIIAGSGMCTGGRVKHHLKHNLWRKECSIIFVGFQAKGTLGREIIEGAKEVEIYGERIAVKAQIHTIGGFSAHAGKSELIYWVNRLEKRGDVYLVHGEEKSIESLEISLRENGFNTHIPDLGESIT